MNNELYAQLNHISNNEFEMVMKTSPIQTHLDISFETDIACYVKRENNNIYEVETKDHKKEKVFMKS